MWIASVGYRQGWTLAVFVLSVLFVLFVLFVLCVLFAVSGLSSLVDVNEAASCAIRVCLRLLWNCFVIDLIAARGVISR